ncbi:MAG: hypothetical protein SFU98_15115 [Leptospiraceae bacterium]|nr:hypothetical protein [Leptospiraceae bacterium]
MISLIVTISCIFFISLLMFLISGDIPYNTKIILKTALFGFYSILQIHSIQRIFKSITLSIMSLFFILVLLANIQFGFIISQVFVVLYLIFLFKNLFANIAKLKFTNLLTLIIISFLLSTSVVEQTFENITDPFVSLKVDQLVLNPDTLFHSSIAEMIKNYGKVSTGLHGLPRVHYHVLSHFLYAQVASILNFKTYLAYGFSTYLVFAPILVYVYLNLLSKFTRFNKLRIGAIFAFLIFNSFTFSKNFGQGASNLTSESYLIGLILFGSFLEFIYIDMNNKNIYFRIITSCIYFILAPIAKITVGFTSLTIFLIFTISKIKKNRAITILELILGTICWYIGHSFARTINIPNLELKFEWMFYRNVLYPNYSFVQFIVSHFSFLWLSILILISRIYKQELNRTKLYLELFTVVLIGLIGFAGLNIVIDSSGYYFSNLTYFYSGFIIIKYLRYLPKFERNVKLDLSQITILFTLIYCSLNTFNHYFGSMQFSFLKMNKIKLDLISNTNYKNQYLEHLSEIYFQDKNYMVYIPKTEKEFWENLDDKISPWNALNQQCAKMPFIIPIVSGKPAIFGLPKKSSLDKCYTFFRGYESYSDEDYLFSSIENISNDDVCKVVLSKKFNGYFLVTKSKYEKITCSKELNNR